MARPDSRASLVVLMAVGALGWGQRPLPGLTAAARCPAVRQAVRMSADSDLWASLRSRMEQVEGGATLPVLGVEDIGADQMGPQDVIDYVMNAFKVSPDAGFTAFLQFSLKEDGEAHVDALDQIMPGSFSEPAAFGEYLRSAGSGRYRVLTELSESKCMGAPEMKDMSRGASQKLLIRAEGSNWRDLFINLRLMPFEPVKRWVIISVHMSGN